MLNLFKQKCPSCSMVLDGDKDYPEEAGKKFCSENCKQKYKQQSAEKSANSEEHSCCSPRADEHSGH